MAGTGQGLIAVRNKKNKTALGFALGPSVFLYVYSLYLRFIIYLNGNN